ncbi:IS6 family transposase [Brucella sp. TWI559]
MTINFKAAQRPRSIIFYAVFFYVRYPRSYRDLQEITAEHGVDVGHATLNRSVARYAAQIAAHEKKRQRPMLGSWRFDETYIQIKGKWSYLYRAVDRDGQTLDVMLTECRDLGAARRFFKKAITSNGIPHKIVIDKSGGNLAGAQALNAILIIAGHITMIEILQVKYHNNRPEQGHHLIKWITKNTLAFKALHSTSATIAGIEVAHMIRKKHFANNNRSPLELFTALAA